MRARGIPGLVSALLLTLITPTPAHALDLFGTTCKNSQHAEHYIADDKGQLCRRNSVDWSTGCCKFKELEACLDCDPVSGCCAEYEMCVSCCLQPSNNPETQLAISPRGANKPETGYFSTTFDYCRAKCRTNSKSTVHENAYKSEQHHCFSTADTPKEVKSTSAGANTPTKTKRIPNYKVVLGNQGEACDKACERAGSRCVASLLGAVNNCDTMKEHFACENGCQDSFGGDQPAYVVPSALRMHQPGVCMINTRPDTLGCDNRHPNTKRLCTCSPNNFKSATPKL